MSNPYPKTMHEDVAPGILNSHPPYRLLMGALFLALIATLSPAASANISTRRRRRHGKITRTQKERKKKPSSAMHFCLASVYEATGRRMASSLAVMAIDTCYLIFLFLRAAHERFLSYLSFFFCYSLCNLLFLVSFFCAPLTFLQVFLAASDQYRHFQGR